jgi:hypothetical protein
LFSIAESTKCIEIKVFKDRQYIGSYRFFNAFPVPLTLFTKIMKSRTPNLRSYRTRAGARSTDYNNGVVSILFDKTQYEPTGGSSTA